MGFLRYPDSRAGARDRLGWSKRWSGRCVFTQSLCPTEPEEILHQGLHSIWGRQRNMHELESDQSQADGFRSLAALGNRHGDTLPLREGGKTGAAQGRDMHEDILAAD